MYIEYLKLSRNYTHQFLSHNTLGYEQYKDLDKLKSLTDYYGREEIEQSFSEKLNLLFKKSTQSNVETPLIKQKWVVQKM